MTSRTDPSPRPRKRGGGEGSRCAALVVVAALLSACAAVAPPLAPESLFADRLFAPPSMRLDADALFTADAAMRRYLATDIADLLRTEGAQVGLARALQERTQLKLEYDAERTKTAAEAFASRTGNCLSLVVMTAALAKELGVPVGYRSVAVEPTLSRSGELLLASGHVNVVLGRRLFDAGTPRDLGPLTIDFMPAQDGRRVRARTIDEATVVAMYANNRAAEALVERRLDDAYAWASEAVRRDPAFAAGVNTLGVVYLKHGAIAEAERVFVHLVDADPDNAQALANLVGTYVRAGRAGDAERVRKRLAAVEPIAPFHFFDLGVEAMRRGDALAARELFERELARSGPYHEFHFWLAQASSRIGDAAEAKKQLALALEASLTRGQQQIYAAKLAWLRAQALH